MRPSATGGERARYFFTVRCGDSVFPDRTGVELPEGADLEACARFLADRLMRDAAIAPVLSGGCRVDVSDSRGVLVRTVLVPEVAA